MRGLGRPSAPAARAASTFSSALAPNPAASFSLPASAALRRSSIVSTPSSWCSARTRLGPSPGMRVISTRPAGIFAFSLSADGMSPSATSASIFSAIVFPMPASSSVRPCAAISATDTPESRIDLAALR